MPRCGEAMRAGIQALRKAAESRSDHRRERKRTERALLKTNGYILSGVETPEKPIPGKVSHQRGSTLLRTKVTVPDYCFRNLTRLFSPSKVGEWEDLKLQCNDAHLNQADRRLYYDNLRAVLIALVQIAVGRDSSLASSISFDTRAYVQAYLHKRGLTDLASLVGEYDRAFGSSGGDRVQDMVRLFAKNVTQLSVAEATKRLLYERFCRVLRALLDEFESIELVSVK
jgi:hypothetical protein